MRIRAALLILFLGLGASLWWRTQTDPQNGQAHPPVAGQEKIQASQEREPFPSASPSIRVCLTNSARKSFQLSFRYPCRVSFENDKQAGKPTRPSRPGREEFVLSPSKLTITAASDGTEILLGDRNIPARELCLVSEQMDPDLWVNDHQYRGEIWFHSRPGNRLLAVNHLPLEQYLGSVVDSEMPASFPDEARKAQAIVARTYALYRMQESTSNPFYDVYATTLSQQYLGVQYRTSSGRRLAGESVVSRRLVRETGLVVCQYKRHLFPAYYSAVCGGKTTTGSLLFPDAIPLHQSVSCEFCKAADLYHWNRSWPVTEASELLSQSLSRRGIRFGEITGCENLSRSPGPAAKFRFDDGRTSQRFSGQEIRTIFPGLPSPTFTLTLTEKELRFEGAGHGHGVGLCQWGARGLALEGKTAPEILNYYYPGVELEPYRQLPAARRNAPGPE